MTGPESGDKSLKMPRPAKKKTRSATAAELEHILEDLMLEVANSFPQGRYERIPHGGMEPQYDWLEPQYKTWAHMTAMYVSEVVKRRSSDRETIIKNAKRAVRRRIERELADSYLGMVLPEGEAELGGVDSLKDPVPETEPDK